MAPIDKNRQTDSVEQSTTGSPNLQVHARTMENAPKPDLALLSRQMSDSGILPAINMSDNASGLRLAVMPRETTANAGGSDFRPAVMPPMGERAVEGDRGQGARVERPGEPSVSLPSREDLQTKPISELKDWLSRTTHQLEDAITRNFPELQKLHLGFHGTSKEGQQGLEREQEARSKDGDHKFYVGTPSHDAANAKEWMANIGRSMEKAGDYARNGGAVAVIDVGKIWTRPNGSYGGVTDHGDEEQRMREEMGSRGNPYMQTPARWGEIDVQLDKGNYAEKMKGWLDPSKWGDLKLPDPTSLEQAIRRDIGQAFARNGMISDLLQKVGIHVGEPVAPGNGNEYVDPRERQLAGGEQRQGSRSQEQRAPGKGEGSNEPTFGFDDPTPRDYQPGGRFYKPPEPQLQPRQPEGPQMQRQPAIADGPGGETRPQPRVERPDPPKRLNPEKEKPGNGPQAGREENENDPPGVERVRNPILPPGLEGMKNGERGSDKPDSVRQRDVDSVTPLPGGRTMYNYHGELTEQGSDRKEPVKFESAIVIGADGKTVQGAQTNYDPPTDITFAGKSEKANRGAILEGESKVEIEGVKNVVTMHNPDGTYNTIVTGKNGSYVFDMDKNQKITRVIGPDGKEID